MTEKIETEQPNIIEATKGIDAHRVIGRDKAADFIGVSVATFKRMNADGRGPKRVRLSAHRVGYRYCDLIDWLEARVITSDEPEAA